MMKPVLRRKLRKKTGYSLAESLLAVLIVALLSLSIATGVAFGARQYRRAMIRAEARILCSTLSSILRDELSNTGAIEVQGGALRRYASPHYTPRGANPADNLSEFRFVDADGAEAADGFGRIELRSKKSGEAPIDTPLLGKAAYSKSYALEANVSVTYDGTFTVALRIRTPDGTDQVQTAFSVMPLNDDMRVTDVA